MPNIVFFLIFVGTPRTVTQSDHLKAKLTSMLTTMYYLSSTLCTHSLPLLTIP